ncbi:unnamed protein product [Rotaria magnacalcarata]|uniref:Uncharacterized protein n=1 Tax=Rotaria magnacalcarata TaxID=392030 RepID=A0A8S3FEC8_9BILA|nr:unnamed protein product [Rotaria magnacalcarata]
MSNFLNIFVEEYGQHPAFNILESCEQVVKRFFIIALKIFLITSFPFTFSDELKLNNNENNSLESVIRLNQLSQFCSNRSRSSFTKRWEHTVEGPISIDFIHQMLESRKVQSYPYPAEIDPYLVTKQKEKSDHNDREHRRDQITNKNIAMAFVIVQRMAKL